MKSWIALIKREFIEHRVGYLHAPAVITLAVTVIYGILVLRLAAADLTIPPDIPELHEVLFAVSFTLWRIYLLISLFFYFSDAFHADERHNALLFWKSMPQSDLKILGSKVAAGFTIFPLVITAWAMVNGLLLYLFVNIAGVVTPSYTASGPLVVFTDFFWSTCLAIAYTIMALLWYAPFFGWAAMLGTLFKRWSIPLFFFIPLLAGILEYIVDIGDRMATADIQDFLIERLEFSNLIPFDATAEPGQIAALLSNTDWSGTLGGVLVMALFVYIASEVRKRQTGT